MIREPNIHLAGFECPAYPHAVHEVKRVPNLPEVARLCIRDPRFAKGFQIPTAYDKIRPLLAAAVGYEMIGNGQGTADPDARPYCYITVQDGPAPDNDADQWHSDGFSTRRPCRPDHNYLISSFPPPQVNLTPVTFPADFDPAIHNVNEYLARKVDPDKTINLISNSLYMLDSYCIHRRPPGSAGKYRRMIRIVFTELPIDDVANTRNPLIPVPDDLPLGNGYEYRMNLQTYPGHREPLTYPGEWPT